MASKVTSPMAFSPQLMDQLVFYGQYHNNPWNKLIHAIFVPAIWWSTVVMLSLSTGDFYPGLGAAAAQLGVPSIIASNLLANGALVGFLIYALYYVYLDRVAGVFASFFLFLMYLSACHMCLSLGSELSWKIAAGVNLLSWYMQIHPGHGIFEGRKPALMDSLVQALMTAPYFVWFEVLFLFGYAPATHAALQKRIDVEVAKFKAAKAEANKTK